MKLSKRLKLLRAYKLQLIELGYIAVNGDIKGCDFYRELLRSGKQEKVKITSDNRTFQGNRFLHNYFNGSPHLFTNPAYKEVIKHAVGIPRTRARSYKAVNSISKRLLKLKHIEIFTLFDGQKLIKDNRHNKMFLYKNDAFYRLVNGKCIKY